MSDGSAIAAFDRMKGKVTQSEAVSQAKSELAGHNMEDRLEALEKEDRIEQLLAEMKTKAGSVEFVNNIRWVPHASRTLRSVGFRAPILLGNRQLLSVKGLES